MNTFEYVTGTVYLLAPALADPAQTEWKLVYRDAQALVWMRRPPAGVGPLDSLEVFGQMEAECGLHLDREPDRSRCARSLAQTFAKIGDFTRARRWLGVYLDHPHPPDPEDRASLPAVRQRGKMILFMTPVDRCALQDKLLFSPPSLPLHPVRPS